MTENTAEDQNPENENTTEVSDNVEQFDAPVEDDPIALLTKERDDMRDKMSVIICQGHVGYFRQSTPCVGCHFRRSIVR